LLECGECCDLMNANHPSEGPRDRPPRPLPKRKRLDVRRLHEGVAWVLAFLILRRFGLLPAGAAQMANVGVQTVREYLRLDHPDAWCTAGLLAVALGFFPDELERLTRRWMRKFRHRESRLHAAEPGWCLRYPWELPGAVAKPGLKAS
jgi:hypothetical protein